MSGIFEPYWDGDFTKPCPALPLITSNFSTGDQLQTARAHFVCEEMRRRGTSTFGSVAEFNNLVVKGDAWVRAQMAKYVNQAGMTSEAIQRVQEMAAADPTLQPLPPQIQPSQPPAAAARAPQLSISAAPLVGGVDMVGVGATSKGGVLGTVGTILGGPAGGVVGGIVGGITDVLGGIGKSKCPGPYNYNPQTGGCDPKPGTSLVSTGGGGSPLGPQEIFFPPSSTSVGVTTPAEYGLSGYTTGMDDWGRMYAEPLVFSRNVRKCPEGTVLGKNGLCYAKGSGAPRMWKKPPKPILSAHDGKTLRQIAAIQKRIRKANSMAGLTATKKGSCRTPRTTRKR